MPNLRKPLRYLTAIPSHLKRYFWTCDFDDFRLIVEQSGQLRSFVVPGRLQRLFMRGVLLALTSTLLLLSALAGYNRFLAWDNETLKQAISRDESSKQRVWQLLSVATSIDIDKIAALQDDELDRMSNAILDREKELLKLLRYAAHDLENANQNLQLVLRVSGLKPAQLEALKKELPEPKAPSGGVPNLRLLAEIDPDIASRLGKQVKINEQLKGVYELLPSATPLEQAEMTSSFGMRVHPVTHMVDMHEGLDLIPGSVRQVTAAADGVVLDASYRNGYGNTVEITHPKGIRTLYAHLSKSLVGSGETVRKGQSIGIVGNTGLSTGVHLHYEISVNGQKINPLVAMLARPNVPQVQK